MVLLVCRDIYLLQSGTYFLNEGFEDLSHLFCDDHACDRMSVAILHSAGMFLLEISLMSLQLCERTRSVTQTIQA